MHSPARNKNKLIRATACFLTFGAISWLPAQAQVLHAPFDGNAAPGKIYQSSTCTAVDEAASGYPCVKYVPGRSGQAIEFGKGAAMAIPLSIDPRTNPLLTMTAWIKRPATQGMGGYIVSSGGIGGFPQLRLYGGRLVARAGKDGLEIPDIPRNEWVFVAGVWDYGARTLRLHAGSRTANGSNLRMDIAAGQVGREQTWLAPGATGEKRPYLFIGAQNFLNFPQGTMGVAVDDVRIYTRALGVDEINALAAAGAQELMAGATGGTQVGSTATGTTPTGTIPTARACTAANAAGDYSSTYGKLQCRTGGSGLSCGYMSGYTIDLAIDTRIGKAVGKWDHNDGKRSGPAEFGITGDCRLASGWWSEDAGTRQTAWNIGSWSAYTGVEPYTVAGASTESTTPTPLTQKGDVDAGSAVANTKTILDGPTPLTQKGEVDAGGAVANTKTILDGPTSTSSETKAAAASKATPPAGGSTTASSQSQGQTRPYPTGDRINSGVAGHRGTTTRTLDLVSSFMSGIAWDEVFDIPCALAVIPLKSSGTLGNLNLRNCRPPLLPLGFVGEALSAPATTVGLSGAAIGRLEVCNANRTKSLKGVRIWGDTINADGSTTYHPATDQKSHNGCDVWSSSTALCPEKTLSTGLVVYTQRESNRINQEWERIVGLQLICRNIAVR